MSNETISRRYASALADVAGKTGDAAAVRGELLQLGTLFRDNPDLNTVFSNPAISYVDKSKVLESIIARAVPSKTTSNFLRVLLKNGRVIDLPGISERFDTILEERSGVVSAEVTSAREIQADEKSAFEKNLEQLTGKRVNVHYQVDQNIIGGIVTRIGSTVYDDSVKTKLETLREQLVNG